MGEHGNQAVLSPTRGNLQRCQPQLGPRRVGTTLTRLGTAVKGIWTLWAAKAVEKTVRPMKGIVLEGRGQRTEEWPLQHERQLRLPKHARICVLEGSFTPIGRKFKLDQTGANQAEGHPEAVWSQYPGQGARE